MAHTANDAVDVFDTQKYLFSIPDLRGVAGALVSDEANLIFSSNRGENTVGIFAPGPYPEVTRIKAGVGPNGLAYDHGRKLLLAANVGEPALAGSHTVTMVDVGDRAVRAEIAVPGRTRWTVFDPDAATFYINIADPAVIVVIDSGSPIGSPTCSPRPRQDRMASISTRRHDGCLRLRCQHRENHVFETVAVMPDTSRTPRGNLFNGETHRNTLSRSHPRIQRLDTWFSCKPSFTVSAVR